MTNHDAAFAFACMLDDVCRCIRNGYDHSALMYLGEVEGCTSGSLVSVRVRYMATWRGLTLTRVRRLAPQRAQRRRPYRGRPRPLETAWRPACVAP